MLLKLKVYKLPSLVDRWCLNSRNFRVQPLSVNNAALPDVRACSLYLRNRPSGQPPLRSLMVGRWRLSASLDGMSLDRDLIVEIKVLLPWQPYRPVGGRGAVPVSLIPFMRPLRIP